MSTTFISGFVGVSTQSSRTGSANAASTVAGSVRSTVSSRTPSGSWMRFSSR